MVRPGSALHRLIIRGGGDGFPHGTATHGTGTWLSFRGP